MRPEPAARFQRSLNGDLDQPVQRFFTHAIRDGAALGGGVGPTMTGRIRVGTWLPFTAAHPEVHARIDKHGARGGGG